MDYKTAFRWRHRFLKSLAGDKPAALSGVVESDETFILESFKGKRSDLPRKARLRDPELLADELFLLGEGARVAVQALGPRGPVQRLFQIFRSLVAAHTQQEN